MEEHDQAWLRARTKTDLPPWAMWAEAVAHVRTSPCLQGPSFFLLPVLGHECGRTCGLDPGAPKCGSLRKLYPLSQGAHQSFVSDAHCQASSRLLMAIMTECTPNGEALWVPLTGLGSAARHQGPPAQEDAPVR